MEGARRSVSGAPGPGAGLESTTPAAQVAAIRGGSRPVIPPGIDQYFLPDAAARGELSPPVYAPVVLGAARLRFMDAKLGIDISKDVLYETPITGGALPVDWRRATEMGVGLDSLRPDPESAEASFLDLPPPAQQPKNYAAWQKSFTRWLAETQRIGLLRHRATKLTSAPGEEERDFRAGVHDALRAKRDAEVDAIRKKFAVKRESLAERVRRAEAATGREQQQASQQRAQTMLSMGAAALGAFFGRKVMSAGTLGRATTAARGVGRSMKEAEDVKRAAENAVAAREKLEAFDQKVRDETDAIIAEYERPVDLERISLAPGRGQIEVRFVALGWKRK
jgi:hypothetical protein